MLGPTLLCRRLNPAQLTQTVRKYGVDSQVWNEKRVVGYSCEQLYSVVSKVEDYQYYVPYCKKSVVTLRREHSLSANLVVRFQPFFNLSYTSHVTLIQPHLVTAVCKDMNLFDHLHTVWKFSPVENHPENTQVDFVVAFKFKNAFHSYVAGIFIDEIVKKNMKAFLGRTQHIYGSEKLVKADSPVIQHSTTRKGTQ